MYGKLLWILTNLLEQFDVEILNALTASVDNKGLRYSHLLPQAQASGPQTVQIL